MRKHFVLIFVLSLGLLLNGQTASKLDNNTVQSDLANFKALIEQHPVAIEALKANPSLLGTPQFARSHRRVGEYIAAHPNLSEEVKANPKFIEGLSAKSAGGDGKGKSR
jgi:hypothetical protein